MTKSKKDDRPLLVQALDQIKAGFGSWIKITPTSLERRTKHKATKLAITRLLAQLNVVGLSYKFWRGDAFNLAKDLHGADFATSMFEPLEWDIHTWQNAASVCSRIEPERRRDLPVFFSHHATVAYMPPDEQDELLERVVVEKLTVKQLQQIVRERKAAKEGEDPRGVTGGPVNRLEKLHKTSLTLWYELPAEWKDVADLVQTAIDSFADAVDIARSATDSKLRSAA